MKRRRPFETFGDGEGTSHPLIRGGKVVPQPGKCRLCLEDGDLQKSHFMPAALYPEKKKKIFATRNTVLTDAEQIKGYLLCRTCEAKFNCNGESEVLRWLAAKAPRKNTFPLLDKLKGASTIYTAPDLMVYSGSVLGIDTDKFAYFALSVLWRAAVHQWTLPDGTLTSPLDLGAHEEPIRKFLMEENPFPPETSVVVTVCTDLLSREHWMMPMFGMDRGCMTFPFLVLGVIFRVWLGSAIPQQIRGACCHSSPEKPIFSTRCGDETLEVLGNLAPM
jgi:hypothetical protein